MKVYASISGGKDSLAALITHMERGGQCDGAIYCRIMFDEETRVRHDFTYHGGEEKKILRQVVYKVTGGYAYELVYTASGRKVRTQLGADCTPAEKVEIEYLFDFYKRLWEKEKDAFLAAYIQKHRIFAIRADVEPQEISREEALKMGALMQGMSDESPLRAIEAGK